jgi:phosphodiesterase/alkaline phosphatase D-like protein
MSCDQLWLGGLTATSVNAVAKLNVDSESVRLACWDAAGNWTRSDAVATVGNVAKLTVTGLTPNTAYQCRVEPDTRPAVGTTGSFTTLPSGTNVSFTAAMFGDASSGSNHAVFDQIRTGSGARFAIHMGDMHYCNLAVNSAAHFRAALDEVFAQPRQARLYRTIPTDYVWDDHDYGPNNSDGSSVGHDAACAIYRARVPHRTLADATATAPIHHSWVIGRVRFVLTDQRSASSARAATDNSSKTMLGASQKAWWKSEISAAAAAGQMVVWLCPRTFQCDATAGADHWGGFTTERTELCSYIAANAPGRVIVISADMHAMRIGNDRTFGGEALRVFQVATLDHPTIDTTGYGGVNATGATAFSATNGAYTTMQIEDSGGSSIGVTWRGFNTLGGLLMSDAFAVPVA